MLITDNGKGFNPEKANEGFGLKKYSAIAPPKFITYSK